MMARTPYYNQLGFESAMDRRLVTEALELTDTAAFASRPLAQLSGGERQRVFIARALAQDTPVLLLDEPTSFLDFRHQVQVYDLLKSVQREKGTTIVAVTHDINLAAQYCDQVLLLSPCSEGPAEGICHCRLGPTSEVFTPAALRRAFSVGIFSAPVGIEKVFLPLGKMAKDASKASPGSDADSATIGPQ
jgi:iron complex transport system ATP-binding protein